MGPPIKRRINHATDAPGRSRKRKCIQNAVAPITHHKTHRSFSAQLIVQRMSKYVRSLRPVPSRDRSNERASRRKASLQADRSRNPFLMNRKVYVLSRNEIMRAAERGFRFTGERTSRIFCLLYIYMVHGVMADSVILSRKGRFSV